MVGFNIGICIPNTCSPEFIAGTIEERVQGQIDFPISVSLIEENCYDDEPIHFTGADIFAM